jgi:hypothetical protein
MPTPVASAGSHIFSLIMQVYIACNVTLNVLAVIFVSNIMGSVSERTEVSLPGSRCQPW